jgi:hypothetical protein
MSNPDNKVLHDALIGRRGDLSSLVQISGKSDTYWKNQCNPDREPSKHALYKRDLRWIHSTNPDAAWVLVADLVASLASWDAIHTAVPDSHSLIGQIAKEGADVVFADCGHQDWKSCRKEALEAVAKIVQYIGAGDHEHRRQAEDLDLKLPSTAQAEGEVISESPDSSIRVGLR